MLTGGLLPCSVQAHNTQIDAAQSHFEVRAVKKEKCNEVPTM